MTGGLAEAAESNPPAGAVQNAAPYGRQPASLNDIAWEPEDRQPAQQPQPAPPLNAVNAQAAAPDQAAEYGGEYEYYDEEADGE